MSRKNKFLAILAGVGVVVGAATLVLLFIWVALVTQGGLIIAICILMWVFFIGWLLFWLPGRAVYKRVYRYLNQKEGSNR